MSVKRFFRNTLKSSLCVSIFILFVFISSWGNAQPQVQKTSVEADIAGLPLENQLPTDPKVIIGKLDNGLTYYIRHNTEPQNRADIRLIINSGSILEEEDQRGIAHFLEHMAFQGTENFEKQSIFDFMESIGMRIGSGVNAATGSDETYYMLELPTDNTDHLKTAFQILRDWACGITFDPEEIESERKVIIEEWRQGQGAGNRLRDKIIPVLYRGSLYAERRPIGTLEAIQGFTRDDLIRFYRDWYRPDLMAVIAVGDFDAEVIRKIILEKFNDIPAPVNPKERKIYSIPEHEETLFAIATDPEIIDTDIYIYHKFPRIYDWTAGGYRQDLVESLYNSMLTDRFRELSIKEDPPFMRAYSSESSLVRHSGVYVLQATVHEKDIERGLETLLAESERVSRYGFTPEEMERTKKNMLRQMEISYANRESRYSSSHASEMTRSYLTGEHIPGAEVEMDLYKRFIPEITLDEVNQLGKKWISDSNRVIIITALEKQGLTMPAESDLEKILASAEKKEIDPYKPTEVAGKLVESIPQGSSIIETQEMDGGLTEWKLANGITVVLKPTDFVKDQILFIAFSTGGTSLSSDENFIPASTAGTIITIGGLGKFNIMELRNMLAGKNASVMPMIDEYQEGLTGGGSPDDLETLFQLIYLYVTQPRADKTLFNIVKNQALQSIKNKDASPSVVFQETWNRLVFSDHPRKQPETVEMIEKMDLEKSMAFYKDRFADTDDFVFVFAGNFEPARLQPFVETYIGALPGTDRDETWRDVGIRTIREGVVKETVYKGQEPKSTTRIGFNGIFANVDDNYERSRFSAGVQVLENRLRKVIRELMGGSYTIPVHSAVVREPLGQYMITIDITTDPERLDEMVDVLFAEIKKLKEFGPTENEVADVKEAMLRTHETSLEQNAFWVGRIAASYKTGIEPGASQIFEMPDTINAVTAESVRNVFLKYLDTENYIQATLLPENIEKQEN